MPRKIENADYRGLYADLRGYTGISDDSRNVKKGDIFFAIQGTRFDGNKFIEEAVRKGAVAVVTGKNTPQGCKMVAKVIRVDNPRAALAQCASEFYGNPSRRLKVIGITGTNGKTTVSYLLEAIFKKAGYETGLIGTNAHKWKARIIEAKNTTPGALESQRLLAGMADDGVDYCMMEVSSHSLDQDRTAGIDFNSAIFTNITGEHLDYHKTFEKYLEAKGRLFKALKAGRTAIINIDDENAGEAVKGASADILTYGIENKADIWADEVRFSLEGSEFLIRINKGKEGLRRIRVRTPLFGRFNVYNILAAVAMALREGIDTETIREALLDFKGAEGRLEALETGAGFKVFIDYAHTDNALENVLKALRPLAGERLLVVFGCGGERDRSKRPRMGTVASRLADYVFITSDNPRGEAPLAIMKEIERGVDKGFRSYEIILDRFEAIKGAIAKASAGDIILIAGKGHEKYQIIGDKPLPFSDREVVLKILNPNPLTQTHSPEGRGNLVGPSPEGRGNLGDSSPKMRGNTTSPSPPKGERDGVRGNLT